MPDHVSPELRTIGYPHARPGRDTWVSQSLMPQHEHSSLDLGWSHWPILSNLTNPVAIKNPSEPFGKPGLKVKSPDANGVKYSSSLLPDLAFVVRWQKGIANYFYWYLSSQSSVSLIISDLGKSCPRSKTTCRLCSRGVLKKSNIGF